MNAKTKAIKNKSIKIKNIALNFTNLKNNPQSLFYK
jgi:hypothetical protein